MRWDQILTLLRWYLPMYMYILMLTLCPLNVNSGDWRFCLGFSKSLTSLRSIIKSSLEISQRWMQPVSDHVEIICLFGIKAC